MQFLCGLFIGIIGIFLTIWFGLERSPDIAVVCHLLPNGDPSALECKVCNSGKKEALNVNVCFNKILPLGTKVFAGPEVGAELFEAELPPNPQTSPFAASLSRAFSIRIPRVPPKDSMKFQIRTTDPDNQRAANQVIRIRAEILKILQAFGERLSEIYPEDAVRWDIDTLITARIKNENFFKPGQFSYEKGRFPIVFLTEKEQFAMAIDQDLYKRYKKEFIDIYQNRPEFKAPVMRINTSEDVHTFAMFPPYISTYVNCAVSTETLRKQGNVAICPPVPKSYE